MNYFLLLIFLTTFLSAMEQEKIMPSPHAAATFDLYQKNSFIDAILTQDFIVEKDTLIFTAYDKPTSQYNFSLDLAAVTLRFSQADVNKEQEIQKKVLEQLKANPNFVLSEKDKYALQIIRLHEYAMCHDLEGCSKKTNKQLDKLHNKCFPINSSKATQLQNHLELHEEIKDKRDAYTTSLLDKNENKITGSKAEIMEASAKCPSLLLLHLNEYIKELAKIKQKNI